MENNRDQDQTLSLILKINYLVLGLGLAVYGMYHLNTRGLPAPIAKIVGVQVQSAGSLDWCDTRITSIYFGNGRRIFQEGMKWFADGPENSGELDFIAVEKWFGSYCKVPVKKHEGSVAANAMVASVDFIDGAKADFKADGKGFLTWKGQVFASPVLESAFLELMQLPVVD